MRLLRRITDLLDRARQAGAAKRASDGGGVLICSDAEFQAMQGASPCGPGETGPLIAPQQEDVDTWIVRMIGKTVEQLEAEQRQAHEEQNGPAGAGPMEL